MWCISYSEWSASRRCFITIIYKLFCGKVQESHEGLELNGGHQHLVYADVNVLIYENTHSMEVIEAVWDTSKEAGLEVKADKNKDMFVSHHHAGQSHNLILGIKSHFSFLNKVTPGKK